MSLLLCVLAGLAFALTPEALDDQILSVENLDLDPELYRRVEQPLVLQEGALTITLKSGAMVPIFSGYFRGKWERDGDRLLRELRAKGKGARLPDPAQRGSRELVGFVWLNGEADVEMSLQERSDALRFANRQVLYGSATVEEMAPIARGEATFTTTADQGVFLSADDRLDQLFLGTMDAQDPDAGDPYEVVVYPENDRIGRAQALLEQRLKVWAGQGLDWTARVARDRVAREVGDDAEPALLADVSTATRYRAVSALPDGSEDRWLAVVQDPLGLSDPRWHSMVVTAGRSPEGASLWARLSGVPFEPLDAEDADGPRRPSGSIEPVSATSRTFVQFHEKGDVLSVEQQVAVLVEAHRPMAFVDLRLPRTEAMDDTFVVKSITIDGEQAFTTQQTGRDAAAVTTKTKVKVNDVVEREVETVDASRVRVVFPEPLQPGDQKKIVFAWSDTWPYANWAAMCGVEKSRGASTGLQYFLPDFEGNTSGGPWTYTASVGVPAASKLHAAISGKTAKKEEVEGWRITTTERTRTARWPAISVGRFHFAHDPAVEKYPAVEAHLLQAFPGQLEGMAPEVRRVVRYLSGWLPPFPVDEIDIVEAPASCGGFVWKAPHGMAELQRSWSTASTGGFDTSKLAHSVFAHEVAHQYFGQLAMPGSVDDRWMIESFAEVFSCMYVGAAFEKPELCTKRMEQKRNDVERDADDVRMPLSLSEAFRQPNKNRIVYRYGPYVLERMLRPRLGNRAFFSAVDVMLREHPREPITNERLQHYLEAASGEDLSDFFTFWVDVGLLPRVDARIEVGPDGPIAVVTGDVPFGTFDIEVELREGDRVERHWIDVVDGEGRLPLDGWTAPKLVVDPDHRTLVRRR